MGDPVPGVAEHPHGGQPAAAVRHTEATVNSTSKDVVDVSVRDGMGIAVNTPLVVGVMC